MSHKLFLSNFANMHIKIILPDIYLNFIRNWQLNSNNLETERNSPNALNFPIIRKKKKSLSKLSSYHPYPVDLSSWHPVFPKQSIIDFFLKYLIIYSGNRKRDTLPEWRALFTSRCVSLCMKNLSSPLKCDFHSQIPAYPGEFAIIVFSCPESDLFLLPSEVNLIKLELKLHNLECCRCGLCVWLLRLISFIVSWWNGAGACLFCNWKY